MGYAVSGLPSLRICSTEQDLDQFCCNACFEKKYNQENISLFKRLIGFDQEIKRTMLTMKKLGILRQMIYSHNHKEEKPRWENYLEQVDRVYCYEYS